MNLSENIVKANARLESLNALLTNYDFNAEQLAEVESVINAVNEQLKGINRKLNAVLDAE